MPLPLDLDDLETSYGVVKSTSLQCSYYWIPIYRWKSRMWGSGGWEAIISCSDVCFLLFLNSDSNSAGVRFWIREIQLYPKKGAQGINLSHCWGLPQAPGVLIEAPGWMVAFIKIFDLMGYARMPKPVYCKLAGNVRVTQVKESCCSPNLKDLKLRLTR